MESTEKKTSDEEFVTVVNVQGTQQSAPSSAESFVTVLSIGTASKQQDKLPEQATANGVDPAHPEEEVEVYRLPGERLGFGLKFEGGNKTSEKVRRLFIQSCAEQSPASRAKCSWGNLGEGDEVLSIDEVPVTQMTRLDCVRRLKESQLVIKLAVRCRGALRPEVVSAERKPQQRSKVPPELPAAPPPVPPRKLRRDPTQAVNRGLADGEASPGMKKVCDSPKSTGSSNTGSPQSQGSFLSAASSIRSSNYESCTSSPIKSGPGSKSESPKDSPKVHVSPVLNKIKQEPPAEAQSYLDARSQDGSSTHGSTSDDTSSSLSTVVDRFSSSDRFSTTSTTSTTSEQQLVVPPTEIDVNGDALLLNNGICMDLSNSSDFLLTRLANSEARTYVESRGDVERVTAVVAPNTVLIEETPALQPPLSFQDAPLSYGHEARPGIFYSADLAADSRTHFRPIKDDAEIVEKVVNGEAPPLPARNHVNRIPINQQEPPKPMPRKELKAKRKRPPPPPPPPRREPPPPVPEARNVEAKKKRQDDETKSEEEAKLEDKPLVMLEESEHTLTNKVLEIVEMKKVKSMLPTKPLSGTSDECEVPNRGVDASEDRDVEEENCRKAEVELRNSINRKMLVDMSNSSTVSMEVEIDSDEEKSLEKKEDTVVVVEEEEEEEEEEEVYEEALEAVMNDQDVSQMEEGSQVDEELAEELRIVDRRRNDEKNLMDEEDVSDESDGDDYYWQSNLATIGEEEENNSLEYENANEDPIPPVLPVETPKVIENIIEKTPETLDKNGYEEEEEQQQQQSNEEYQSVRRIERDSVVEDKKQDKSAVNVRMDNCGGGGQRLPPDGDEFPAAYQEFISPSHQHQQQHQQQQQYQYVTTRETMAANGDVDRGESALDTGKPAGSLVQQLVSKDTAALLIDTVDGSSGRTILSNYVLYGTQKTIVAEKKIEIAAYYSKEANGELDPESEACAPPPPLPLTGPPKVDGKQDRKFSSSNGELWRQDNRSEASVKDKIAMFSSQSSLEAPLFPTTPASSPVKRLSKHKSSDDVFAEDKRSAMCERTQSSFDLSGPVHQKSPSLPQTSPPSSPSGYSYNGYLDAKKSPLTSSNGSSKSSSPLNSYTTNYANKSFDYGASTTSPSKTLPNGLTRATSFSGSTTAPYGFDRLQTSSELLANNNNNQNDNSAVPVIARTNSLVSTFKRPSDEIRKSSLNQLIEQRRKGISKLRGLVIPEKDAMPVDQPIIDLPEIKSRDSILNNNQAPRANIQDKWGSQSSLASNASTVSSSVRTGSTFKMPAPKILSNYSPAFKRKSLTVYGGNSQPNNNNSQTSPTLINGTKSLNTTNNQLVSPASDAPKSLESICSPTRSDYSFDFVSSGGSPDGGNPPNSRLQIHSNKQLSNCQRKLISRNEYDDSDNDSAVSSSQSSISRGFSPPMSPVPSDRSTISSSERSYLSSDNNYPQQRPQLILDNGNKNADGKTATLYASPRNNAIIERSFSVPEKKPLQEQQPAVPQHTMIPQRQLLKRSSSTDTTSSNCSSSTITSASQAESLSRRVLKAQSVEAINRKNILASARCRSGRDLNGSPLIQRKFNDEEEAAAAAAAAAAAVEAVNGEFVSAHRLTNGDADNAKPQIKIAYIEITDNVVAEGGKKDEEDTMVPQQQQPRLPPKRSVIPQAKNVPIPIARPPKPEPLEPSNDMKSWVRAEMRSLATNNSKITSSICDVEPPNPRNFKSKSTLALNEPSPRSQIEPETKPRTSFSSAKKSAVDDHNDLLTVLTTKSRSRSAIHVVEDSSSYGQLKSQMSLEDILAVSSANSSSVLTQAPKLLPRSQSVSCDSNGKNGLAGPPFRNGTVDSWTTGDKISPSKIPSLRIKQQQEVHEMMDGPKSPTTNCSKIPTSRNLGRRSASVTDMKKVFERPEATSSGTSSPGSQSQISGSSTATHNRFPSLDSSVEDSIRPEVDQERFSGEQFGSISSLASSTSLISQQELAQLVEEANLEEPRGGHDVVVVLLHKENPSGSVGITLAGGLDCETKEITIHRVLAHSIADRDGSVQRGDRILSINGRSMRGLTHRESLAVLKQPRSEVVLVVSRAKIEDTTAAAGNRLRNRTESVETIVEGYETGGVMENTAWGPALMVSMYKDGAGLGFSLEGGRDSPLGDRPLLIKKIFTGGAAEKTGALRAGDQLLEVNKRDVSRMSRIEAWSLMKKLPDGEVNLLVRHPATKSS